MNFEKVFKKTKQLRETMDPSIWAKMNDFAEWFYELMLSDEYMYDDIEEAGMNFYTVIKEYEDDIN